MIIECPNCNKKFNLDGKLIPEKGRSLKCSGCAHIWHYKIEPSIEAENIKKTDLQNYKINTNISKIDKIEKANKEKDLLKINENDLSNKKIQNNEFEGNENKTKVTKSIKIKMIFVYIILIIISFLALILLLDTFKIYLSNIFPGINPLFDSMFETLLDLKLFFKDLFN